MTCLASATDQDPRLYDRAVLTEDVTWSGSVLVKGYVVVAPQATLRIDPGTVVHFVGTSPRQLPTLIIQGRIHAAGTPELPIIFASEKPSSLRGSWGGIVFLSTEKRNLLERCRIESPETGVDVRFSTVTLKSVSIVKAQTALLSHDGVVQMTGSTLADSETGLDLNNSEFEGKETVLSSCVRGCVASKSALVFSSVSITNSQQVGFEADDCRLKITGGELSGNGVGARIKGGEGQIFMSRFQKNRQTALQLSGTRIKVQRCLFAENIGEAVRTEDGGALLLNNAFSANGGFNLYNAGREAVTARQNWWGTADQLLVGTKIFDAAADSRSGVVHVFPWLDAKPQLMPN
jgi:hypothetical protein